MEVDIIEVKWRIERIEGTDVDLKIEMGWPKEDEPRCAARIRNGEI